MKQNLSLSKKSAIGPLLLASSLLLLPVAVTAYSAEEYREVYNEKYALELEVRHLNEEMAEVRAQNRNLTRLLAEREARIRELEEQLANVGTVPEPIEPTEQPVSSNVDEQLAYLRQNLQSDIDDGIVIIKKDENNRIVIQIDSQKVFPSHSAEMTDPRVKNLVNRIADLLNRYPDDEIMVMGHTDSVPIHSSKKFRDNWHLASERALTVMHEMIQNDRINKAKIGSCSGGEYRPIKTNDNAVNRASNRRVDIIIVPMAELQDSHDSQILID